MLPDEFDWRDRHGINWLTSAKDQGNTTECDDYAKIAAAEAQINLHYNQILDVDLSEDMLINCKLNLTKYKSDEICLLYGSWVGMMEQGVNEEDNEKRNWKIKGLRGFYYSKTNEASSIKYCDKLIPYFNEDELRKTLIRHGPLSCSIRSWFHSMVLVGYSNERSNWSTIDICSLDDFCYPETGCRSLKCKSEGEIIESCVNIRDPNRHIHQSQIWTYECQRNNNNKVIWIRINKTKCSSEEICFDNRCVEAKFEMPLGTRECSDLQNGVPRAVIEHKPGKGDPFWIFKNSFGQSYEDNGFIKFPTSIENIATCVAPIEPFIDQGGSIEINCQDNDNDDFCNWGITRNKPNSCPEHCNEEKDWDDSNPGIRALEEI